MGFISVVGLLSIIFATTYSKSIVDFKTLGASNRLIIFYHFSNILLTNISAFLLATMTYLSLANVIKGIIVDTPLSINYGTDILFIFLGFVIIIFFKSFIYHTFSI